MAEAAAAAAAAAEAVVAVVAAVGVAVLEAAGAEDLPHSQDPAALAEAAVKTCSLQISSLIHHNPCREGMFKL